MRNYFIRVTLHLGQYEKHAYHLIEADSKAAAQEQALADESHNDEACENENGEYWDGDMVYAVERITAVSDHDADTFRRMKDQLHSFESQCE